MTEHFTLRAENPCLDPQAVERAFLKFTGVSRRDLIEGRVTTHVVSHLRQDLMWLLRDLTSLSHEKIGDMLDGRDPTTIMGGVERVTARMAADPQYRVRIERARAFILDSARLDQEWAAAGAPEDGALQLARRLLAADGLGADVGTLATAMLAVGAVLRSEELTDAEARLAALTLIRNARGSHG